MKESTQFKSENLMMSVLGHLVLIAVMLMSFSVVVERAKLVTPNRIQIVEIDLKDVKVSGSETKLYNTNAPDKKEIEKNDKKSPDKKNIFDEKTQLKQPTMIENESKTLSKEKADEKDKKKLDEKKITNGLLWWGELIRKGGGPIDLLITLLILLLILKINNF